MFGRAWPFRAPVRPGIVPTWPQLLDGESVPCTVSPIHICCKSCDFYLLMYLFVSEILHGEFWWLVLLLVACSVISTC